MENFEVKVQLIIFNNIIFLQHLLKVVVLL